FAREQARRKRTKQQLPQWRELVFEDCPCLSYCTCSVVVVELLVAPLVPVIVSVYVCGAWPKTPPPHPVIPITAPSEIIAQTAIAASLGSERERLRTAGMRSS